MLINFIQPSKHRKIDEELKKTETQGSFYELNGVLEKWEIGNVSLKSPCSKMGMNPVCTCVADRVFSIL